MFPNIFNCTCLATSLFVCLRHHLHRPLSSSFFSSATLRCHHSIVLVVVSCSFCKPLATEKDYFPLAGVGNWPGRLSVSLREGRLAAISLVYNSNDEIKIRNRPIGLFFFTGRIVFMDKSFSFLLYLSLYLSYRRPSPRWWRSNRRNSSSAPPTEVLAVLVIRRRQLLPRSKILATYLFPATVPTKQREDFAYKFGSHRYVSQPPLSFQIIWFAFIRGEVYVSRQKTAHLGYGIGFYSGRKSKAHLPACENLLE